MIKCLPALIGALALGSLTAMPAMASQMEDALANGARKLTAEEITKRLADKTVTFENLNSGAKVLVYYDGENGTILKPVGSNQTLTGFYATDLSDHVCVGIKGDAPMRLRCVNVLLIDGVMHKFELDGSLRGRIIEEVAGNII
ncbi:MAG: hypothetical protein AAF495_11935 [Pseudomonadota bacterium]